MSANKDASRQRDPKATPGEPDEPSGETLGGLPHHQDILPPPSLPQVDAGTVRATRQSIARQSASARDAALAEVHIDRLLACADPRFAVHALGLGATDLTAVDRQDPAAAARDGRVLVVALTASHRVCIRVVVGELNGAESEEWVDRKTWSLSLGCGGLALHGGTFDASRVLRAARRGADDEPYLEVVAAPPGEYEVDLYTYIGSAGEGYAALHAGGGDDPEPQRPDDAEREGAWFRRTRRGEPFPDWLVRLLVADPSRDPGHEEQWRQLGHKDVYRRRGASLERRYVDFLLHLRPTAGRAPVIPADELEYHPGSNRCWPEKLPLGLRAELE